MKDRELLLKTTGLVLVITFLLACNLVPTPAPTPTSTSTPTPTHTPTPGPAFSRDEVLEIPSISEVVGTGTAYFAEGKEPGTVRVLIIGTIPVVGGKTCLCCVEAIQLTPDLKIPTKPWFIDREHEGQSMTVNLELQGPIPDDATEFILSGPEGAALKKEGRGFTLTAGAAYFLQTASP